jgi:hypothetical protein
MMASDALFSAVRVRLEAGPSKDERRLLYKRLARNVALGTVPLIMSLATGGLRRGTHHRVTFWAMAAVLVIAAWLRYRDIEAGRSGRPTDAEVAKVSRKSSFCLGCGSLVLPEAGGECLQCGRFVHPTRTLLVMGGVLAVIVSSVLWRIYR